MSAIGLFKLVPAAVRPVIATCLLLAAAGVVAQADGPAPGQKVVFFPSCASRTATGDWRLTLQGRVYDPDTAHRGLLVRALAQVVHAPRKAPIFVARANLLVSDSAGNTQVTVQVGDSTVKLPPSDAAGYFTGDLVLTDADAMRLASARQVVDFQSVPVVPGGPVFQGEVRLVPEEGTTVISDMDDTIKVTSMLDAPERNANTFTRPFRAVEGMAALYGRWQAADPDGMHFHLVSAGPWQMHEPLRSFTREAGFPDFTWDMRSLDLPGVETLLEEAKPDPQRTYDFKVRRISAFMVRFPRRHVVLVGDSGEMDPEVYATIVARFPERVDHVFIRNVHKAEQRDRYARLYPAPAAFALLQVFRKPEELPPLR